jgi:2-iminobutanoate/2-iminopropanoate deaminase
MKKCIEVPSLPKAGPYSHAVCGAGLVFVSGNLAINAKTGEKINGDIPRATKLILENIETTLKEAGSSLEKVLKTTVFLIDMGKFAEMNGVYGEVFGENPPARSCIGVRELPAGFDIEIEVVALT